MAPSLNRSPMLRLRLAIGLLAVLAAACTEAPDEGAVDALLARYPAGVPWQIEFFDDGGKSLGKLDAVITYDFGKSCLSDFAEGSMRVNYLSRAQVSRDLMLGDYGVAKFTGDMVAIDLTGGICDAYLLVSGPVKMDGSSRGSLSAFGLSSSRHIGSYRAVVRAVSPQ